MPASRQSRYKERYAKLEEDSVAIVQARDFTLQELTQTAEDTFARVPGAILVPIERIEPNPDNPRRRVVDAALTDLAASIAERGLLQPVVVRRNADRVGEYFVIAGSRRLLAARLVHGAADEAVRARVATIPCIIKEESDRDAFADALLENLARADLSRAELMEALLRLHQDYGWSANYIAKRTGRNQSDISQLLGVARHPVLARLVREEVIKPTVAGEINRLPEPVREATITEVQVGTVRTVADVRRRRPMTPVPPPDPAPAAPTTQPSLQFESVDASHAGAVADGRVEDVARGPTATGEGSASLATAALTPPAERAKGIVISLSPAKLLLDLQARLEAIGALAAMVDTGTLSGQAVLTTVERDLAAAYERLAVYLRRQDRAT